MTMTVNLTHRPARPPELMAALGRVTGDEKHEPAALSTLDVLWVLYDRVLRVAPERPDAPDRDRFLLSKGHGPAAYYAVLATKGFFPTTWLDDMASATSHLGGHPDRTLVAGVEIGSGSLGHGLGLAVGTALGLRAQGRSTPRVYALVGDAELDEGSNHEAIAYAGATGLGLTVIVIDNRSATHGWRGGIASRFAVHGWTTATVDGRDHEEIAAALLHPPATGPYVVVARVESKSHHTGSGQGANHA
jgi:transketolase